MIRLAQAEILTGLTSRQIYFLVEKGVVKNPKKQAGRGRGASYDYSDIDLLLELRFAAELCGYGITYSKIKEFVLQLRDYLSERKFNFEKKEYDFEELNNFLSFDIGGKVSCIFVNWRLIVEEVGKKLKQMED